MTLDLRLLNATVLITAALLFTACDSSDNHNDTTVPQEPEPPVVLPTSFTLEGEACQRKAGAEARTLYITSMCVDPDFTQVYIDVDEPRTATDSGNSMTVNYRYIHGGFTDTNARFAFYFPERDEYLGRFFQTTYPTVGTEGAGSNDIVFAISHGAFVVSSNNGGGVTRAPTTGGYRVNASAAKVSRRVAALLYGEDAPVRGYIYGVSGGAYQTLGAAENTEGIWDGAVPIVPGPPNAIPSFQSVQVLGLRGLKDKFPDIVDALEPGGSGDPYATLNENERAILEEVTKMGFPLRGWWQWETATGGAFDLVVLAVLGIDAGYTNDFFNLSGYAGFDDPDVQALRVQFDTSVAAVSENSVTLSGTPTGYLRFADLVITTGAAAGETINNVKVEGNVVNLPADADSGVVEALSIGDGVRVDNSLWVALQYYQRYQVPSPDQYGWNQYRDSSGNPLYVQRPALVGQIIAGVFGGVATGQFNGKMIMLSSILDVEAFPWTGDWYRTQATARFGSDIDNKYRLWYTDNADHVRPRFTAANAHIIDYSGIVQRAILYLDAWVSDGTAPPANSNYSLNANNQVQLLDGVEDRGGIQPLVTLAVNRSTICSPGNDAVRVDVDAGDPVAFSATAATLPELGKIIRIEWDFESQGDYPEVSELDGSSSSVQLCKSHTYTEPGTHFAVVRITSQQESDFGTDYGLVRNIARVRVVVN